MDTTRSSRPARPAQPLVRSEGSATGHFLQPKWGEHAWGDGSLRDRFDAVRPLITGPSVLDVGCASRFGKPDWLHGMLRSEFPDLVGIDIDEGAIRKLQEQGYDAVAADAQAFDLGRIFDAVFAGELIEHLDDPHGFLRSVKQHLGAQGRLVLTTPNAFYVGNFLYRWGGHGQVHPEHTCWYCEDTLRSLLGRNGFAHVEISFTGHTSPTPLRKTATTVIRHVFPPRLAFDTIVVVAAVDRPVGGC
jgi:2-polyprenyl-3-methyl-5-hydroxy-6-metoxy-1,4-benzoquinol methylase